MTATTFEGGRDNAVEDTSCPFGEIFLHPLFSMSFQTYFNAPTIWTLFDLDTSQTLQILHDSGQGLLGLLDNPRKNEVPLRKEEYKSKVKFSV